MGDDGFCCTLQSVQHMAEECRRCFKRQALSIKYEKKKKLKFTKPMMFGENDHGLKLIYYSIRNRF